MFKTSKDFETALKNVLNAILESPDDKTKWGEGISELDLHDILRHAHKEELIIGITIGRKHEGGLLISGDYPRLSYKGLKLLESLSE